MHRGGPRLALAGKEPPEPPACGCLVVIQGRDLGRKFDLARGVTTIGRSETNGICLPYDWVSRVHAEIVCDEHRVVIRDAGSCSGIFVNDHRTTEAVLENGDRIKLAQTILRFFADDTLSTAYHEELYRLSTLDAHTQLFNRRYMVEVLEREVRGARQRDDALSLVVLGIDRFQRCNETFGESAGNSVLGQLADAIRTTARDVDIVGRWGGDRFAILRPASRLEDAVAFADRIRGTVEDTRFMADGQPIPVTISLGVAELESDDGAGDLVARAIARLELAKERGRNRVAH